jgi:tetraacyldisaccharide 4'-kinase
MPLEPGWWYRPPGLIASALAPVAALYGHVAARRLARVATYRSSLPVICAGNFTAGGSGKTPVAAMLAERLIARGERPAILSRGYGGTECGPHWVDTGTDTAERVGDEPLLLARVASVLVARERGAGACEIERHGGFSVIVMDDGLQNRALAKDLIIAVVDGPRGIGNGRVIPAGPLRAPLAAQRDLPDAILFNGTPHANLAATVARNGCPSMTGGLVPGPGLEWLQGVSVIAYAGIGNPARFFSTVASLGAIPVETVAFPDHAALTAADAGRLLALAARHNARLVTTEKDHVRMAGLAWLEALATASVAVPVRMQLSGDDTRVLDELLDAVLLRRR